MTPDVLARVRQRTDCISLDITAVRDELSAQPLSVSDRQYLDRCLDLLEMELTAFREYLAGVSA